MVNVELVIKVPEKQYYIIRSELYNTFSSEMRKWGLEAIRNGTPLPKGHGDLIDRGKLKTHFIGTEQGTDLEVYLEPTIINAPTIVGAESEG